MSSVLALLLALAQPVATDPPAAAAPRPAPRATEVEHDPGALRRATTDCPEATVPAPTPSLDLYAQRVAASPFRRKGFTVAIAMGASGCVGNRDWCTGQNYFAQGVPNLAGTITGVFARESRIGPSLDLEAGYRPIAQLAAVAFFHTAYRPQQINLPETSALRGASAYSLAGGVAVNIHPLAHSRFDPFVGLGIGGAFHRARVEFESDEGIARTYDDRLSRAVVRTSVGIPIFVIQQLTVGPRVGYDFFFGGKLCEHTTRQDPGASRIRRDECRSAATLNELAQVDGFKGPARQLPQMWSVALELRAIF